VWEGEAAGIAVSPLRWFGVFAWAAVGAETRTWHPPEDFFRMACGATWYARAVGRETGRILAEAMLSP
jgi:hypothetical protein